MQPVAYFGHFPPTLDEIFHDGNVINFPMLKPLAVMKNESIIIVRANFSVYVGSAWLRI